MTIARQKLLPVALVAAASLAVAGCGGSKTSSTTTTASSTTTTSAPSPVLLQKRAYVAKLKALGVTIGKEFAKVYPIDTGVSGDGVAKQTADRLAKVQGHVQGALAELRGIKPPLAVAADHRRLEAGLMGVSAELGQVIAALRSGNFAATAVPSRLSDLGIIDSATSAMEAKGFDVLGNAG